MLTVRLQKCTSLQATVLTFYNLPVIVKQFEKRKVLKVDSVFSSTTFGTNSSPLRKKLFVQNWESSGPQYKLAQKSSKSNYFLFYKMLQLCRGSTVNQSLPGTYKVFVAQTSRKELKVNLKLFLLISSLFSKTWSLLILV